MPTTATLLTSAWADLGTTPCFLQNLSNFAVVFVVDVAAPSDAGALGHVLSRDGEMSANVGFAGQRVFARAHLAEAATVVVSR